MRFMSPTTPSRLKPFIPSRIPLRSRVAILHAGYYRFGLMFLAQVIGYEAAQRLVRFTGDFLWERIGLFRGGMIKAITTGLGEGYTAQEIEAIAHEYAKCWRMPFLEAEFAHRKLNRKNLNRHVRFVGFERLLKRLGEGKGVMAAGTYFGSHQIGVTALGLLTGGRVAGIVSPYQFSTQRRWMAGLVRRRLADLYPAGEAIDGSLKALNEGCVVTIVSEHERRGRSAVVTRFMGKQQSFHPTAAMLAWRARCPIAVLSCRRLDDAFHFELGCHDWIEVPTDRRKQWVHETTLRIVNTLESVVRADPAQFAWLRQHFLIGQDRSKCTPQ